MVQPGAAAGWRATTTPQALADAIERSLDDASRVAELIEAGGRARVFDGAHRTRRAARGATRELAAAGRAAGRPRPRAREPPLVSVVVPYFELERLVEETLGSVAGADPPELEVIVVNDGSLREDDADVVRARGAARRPRSSPSPTAGSAAARNFGIAASRGRYVLPLDADDLIAPDVRRALRRRARARPGARVRDDAGRATSSPTARRSATSSSGYMPFGNWTRLIDAQQRRRHVRGAASGAACSSRASATPRPDELRGLVPLPRAAAGGHFGAVIPERLFRYRDPAESMMRELGAPLLERLVGELRAHTREAEIRWTAPAPTR